ncbi:MAG TPA: alpha/beta fold hydrolase [Rhodothermales bacterium]|nr:alpha/beta fold hydrolase [Rhodothermales bacterium]
MSRTDSGTRASKHIAIPVPRRVLSFDGTEIWYDFYEAAGDAAVVILPGFWRTRRHPALTQLAATISRRGHSVAVVDLRGHGDSGGRFGFNREEYRDVEAVLTDVERHRGRLRLVVVGLSLGGAVAVTLTARSDFDIQGLILISAVADFEKIRPRVNPFELPRHLAFGQAFRWPRFDWRFLRSPKLVAAEEIRNVSCPACLIHVVGDWLINHEHSRALQAAHRGPCDLHLIEVPGGYHADRIFSAAPGRVEAIIERFLDERFSLDVDGSS